jgi:hypothetical protein
LLRRITVLLLVLPALALAVWGLSAALPIWSAPQPAWFAPDTPAICALVDWLERAGAERLDPAAQGVIARDEAIERIDAQLARTYDSAPPPIGDPILIRAVLDDSSRTVWIASAEYSNGAALIALDAGTGEPLALIHAIAPRPYCPFDSGAALRRTVTLPPLILLSLYAVSVIAYSLIRRIAGGKRTHANESVLR